MAIIDLGLDWTKFLYKGSKYKCRKKNNIYWEVKEWVCLDSNLKIYHWTNPTFDEELLTKVKEVWAQALEDEELFNGRI